MEKVQLTETEAHPVCPYCEKELSEVHWNKVSGTVGVVGFVAVYSCSHCKKVLGASANFR